MPAITCIQPKPKLADRKHKTPPLSPRKWGFEFVISCQPLWFDVADSYVIRTMRHFGRDVNQGFPDFGVRKTLEGNYEAEGATGWEGPVFRFYGSIIIEPLLAVPDAPEALSAWERKIASVGCGQNTGSGHIETSPAEQETSGYPPEGSLIRLA
ncbi:MAG: hypothetical protein JW932_15520 [Deltaproteobacteria bacterium]|nr:hypothetical protein [Deltaproteobacteria bacterium]